MVQTIGMMLGFVAMAAVPPAHQATAGKPVAISPSGQPMSVSLGGVVQNRQNSVDLSTQFVNWSVQSLDLPGEAGETFTTNVAADGVNYTLVMEPSSLRSSGFQAVVVGADGVEHEFNAAPSKTYRGYVDGLPDSLVGGSLINGQLNVVVDFGDGSDRMFIEPLSDFDPEANLSDHVITFGKDVIAPEDARCGNDELFGLGQSDFGDGGPGDAGGEKTAEIAYDTDHEFFLNRNSDSQRVIDDVERITAALTVIYQRDVGICYTITKIIIRSNSNDPYSGDIRNRLDQLRSEWNRNQGSVQRDLVELLSGLRGGGVIGVSFLGTVCRRQDAYSTTKSDFTNNFTLRVCLSAHEIGHSWNARHCDGSGSCFIMCSVINQCNRNCTKFGARSINTITNFKNSRGCLDAGCNTGGSQVTCDDIKKLKAKCKNGGKIKGKVVLFDGSFDGDTITVAIDGNKMELTINGKKAKFAICCFSAGDHSVNLTNPANCNKNTTVTCQ